MINFPIRLSSLNALNKIIVLIIAFNLICLGLSDAKIITASTEESDRIESYNIVLEGDSLTAGKIYPNYVMDMLNLDNDKNVIHNVATSGQTLYPTMIIDASHQVDTKFLSSNYQNIAVLWAGTNDIFLDTGIDVSTLHESIRDWCNGRKAKGFQVIVCTITPRSDNGTPGSFEENRQAINEMIRAHYLEYADGLADLAGNPYIGDADDELDTMYYCDKVHMTPMGNAIVANIVKDSIIGLTNFSPRYSFN
jgi:lysophospholipase L1-like esterase